MPKMNLFVTEQAKIAKDTRRRLSDLETKETSGTSYTHPNHSGDVTSVGDGATTIAADAVTFAKMQNIATDSLIGRDTASSGDPENITLNATLSMTGSGALQREALTGDVTASAGSNATTIANDAVTNAKAANMAQNTIKGRITASTGDPEDLTAANVRTIINVASGADVTGAAITALTTKATPVDADAVVITDSAASDAPKRTTWANIKAVLKTYFDTLYAGIPTTGTWSPAITGGGGNPTVTYTTQNGKYTNIANMCFYSLDITINTYSGGSGQLRISLPSTVASGSPNTGRAPISISNVDAPASAINVIFSASAGNAHGLIISAHDDAAAAAFTTASLAAGDVISATGWYFTS